MTRAERLLYVTHAVKRRVYGEELASEPSQFLNEMPLELIEDMSRGKSWLSFARGSMTVPKTAAGSLQYEYDDSSPTDEHEFVSARRHGTYSGKTFDNAESIEEFFRKRMAQMGEYKGRSQKAKVQPSTDISRPTDVIPAGEAQLTGSFVPGSYVRHAKYGRGLVLRREGSGDQSKLTVSFPGYGQKKLIEKYAGLESA